jgi:RNA polymerase sigma factor (sigma-70 family)
MTPSISASGGPRERPRANQRARRTVRSHFSALFVYEDMRPSADPSDDALLAAARLDPESFAVFYRRYERLVLSYLMRSTHNPEVSADLCAEVFASAFRACTRYRAEGPTAVAWLLTIAHRTLADSVKRGRVEARARRRLGIRDAVSLGEEELERILALDSLDGEVLALLDALPPDQREVIRARVIDERSYRDIASELELSELVVRKRVSRGLTTLRQTLEEPT